MEGADPTQDAAIALAQTLAERMDRWDAPALLAAIHLDVDTTGDEMALCWRLSTAAHLGGHPFDALMGRTADETAVGAALACEGYMAPRGPSEIADDLAAHAGADGRAEIRDVLVLMRDGTAGHVVSVRGGGHHRAGPAPDGRVPAALARHLGRPSGLAPARAHEVAARLVLATATAAATEAGTSPMHAVATLADRPDAWLQAMSGPCAWLATVARLAGQSFEELTWERVHERLTDLPRLAEHLLRDAVVSPDHCLVDPAATLRWCDAALVGHLFDAVTPTWAELELALVLGGADASEDAVAEMVARVCDATGSRGPTDRS